MAQSPLPLTWLASAARAAAQTLSKISQSGGYRGLRVVIDVTAITDTPSLVVTIEHYDPLSTKYVTLLASAAIVGTGTTVLQVFPGAPATANVSANTQLGRTFRLTAVTADADSITFSISYELLP